MPDTMAYPISFGDAKRAYPWSVLADFIRIARLKKAILLMQNGENRISEIAFQVGFSSPAYFSTCFQKQYGKTPSEYLKQAGTK